MLLWVPLSMHGNNEVATNANTIPLEGVGFWRGYILKHKNSEGLIYFSVYKSCLAIFSFFLFPLKHL